MFKTLLIGASTLVLATNASSAAATNAETTRMEEVIAADVDTGQFMGAVLVAREDAVLLDSGYGSANLELRQPNRGNTKFRIGSLTKQFTAAAVLLLVEDNKVDLDAPIGTYIDTVPPSWDKVTVRNLLNHTGGLPNYTNLPSFAATKSEPTTAAAILDRVKDLPLDFTPGEGWNYSNTGYVALTQLIENVSGLPYGEFLKSRIFTPLGMADTGYDLGDPAAEPDRAKGYVQTSKGLADAERIDTTEAQGAGGISSSTHDLLRWEHALFGGKLLRAESLAAMTKPVRNDYAMGLIIEKQPAGTRIWHNGAIDGFNSYLAWDPERKITVVVLGNVESMAPDRVARKLLSVSQGKTVVLPSEHKGIELPDTILNRYSGTYALGPGFTIVIEHKDGSLTATGSGQPTLAMMPEAEDRFYLREIDAELRFERDASGAVTALVLSQGGRDMVAPKS